MIYKGGLKLTFGAENHFFEKDLASEAPSLTLSNEQSAKLRDHRKYLAASDQYLGIKLPHDYLIEYKLSAFRDSKTFTYSYVDKIPSVPFRSHDDNDLITINHHLGLLRLGHLAANADTAELFGEYSTYTINYLNSLSSFNNSTQDGYRIGLNVKLHPSERFSIGERIAGDAEVSSFLFPKIYPSPSQSGDTILHDLPPPYQRRLSSICAGKWRFAETWELGGRWNETYNDNGLWEGKEYFKPSQVESMRTDYYGITDKSVEYSVDFSLAKVKDSLRIEVGCRYQNGFKADYAFSQKDYVVENDPLRKSINPYIDILLNYRHVSFKGRIVRMFYTMASDRWNIGHNWDIHVAGQASW